MQWINLKMSLLLLLELGTAVSPLQGESISIFCLAISRLFSPVHYSFLASLGMRFSPIHCDRLLLAKSSLWVLEVF